MKLYSNQSNATRAAKKSGLEKFSIIEVDGKFGFKDAKPAPAPSRKAKPVKAPKAPAPKAPVNKGETKGAQLIAMVRRGATVAELMEALGWLPHTTRAALSRLGKVYDVQRTKIGAESHYKIAS